MGPWLTVGRARIGWLMPDAMMGDGGMVGAGAAVCGVWCVVCAV